MFIDRLEVHNNTLVKIHHAWHAYTIYIYSSNVSVYKSIKKNDDNSNTYMHLICVKNTTPPGPYFTK